MNMMMILVTTLSFAWADKQSDLNTLHEVCIKKGVKAFEGRKIKKEKVNDFCDCVKRNMDSEFSQEGDDKQLSLIANFESAKNKKEEKAAEKGLDETEGAYVFMDLFLDIRQECAVDPSTKTSRRPDSIKKSK